MLRRIEAQLREHGMGLGDVVMMRVFLVRPEGPIFFAGEHLSYVVFWQEGAALSAQAAMRLVWDHARANPPQRRHRTA